MQASTENTGTALWFHSNSIPIENAITLCRERHQNSDDSQCSNDESNSEISKYEICMESTDFKIDNLGHPLINSMSNNIKKENIIEMSPTIHEISKSTSSISECKFEGDSTLEEKDIVNYLYENKLMLIPPKKCLMPGNMMGFYNYFPRLDIPSTVLGKPQLVNTFSSCNKISIKDLWSAHMKLLFRNFPNDWTLGTSRNQQLFGSSYHCYRDVAKVRFYCQQCMDGWTSMYGVVIFFYRFDEKSAKGEIYFLIVGQKCRQCLPVFFEMPLWYPEEAQKVITNLYYDIATRIYGLQTPLPIKTRRLGKAINNHNWALCEGCHQGLCKHTSNVPPNSAPVPYHVVPCLYSPPPVEYSQVYSQVPYSNPYSPYAANQGFDPLLVNQVDPVYVPAGPFPPFSPPDYASYPLNVFNPYQSY